ncbi:MAG: pirin family protein [Acidobacteria bacterium]|nr:MAG: pirin family protein [Acidobacteriota bacterium]
MIRHIPFDSLYLADHGWLKSRFHFSFAEYFDKNNMHFGVLRVMNDDLIAPHTGFGRHPHHDMEIVTYILRGELTHQDSMGNTESLGRGAIQYMSAGTGVTHSEMNAGDDEVHLIQTWILPDAKGLSPQYGSKIFHFDERHNKWLHLIGPEGTEAAIHLYQDAGMFAAEIDAGNNLAFDLDTGRKLFVKVMEGKATINGISFMPGDAAQVEGETLNVEARSNAHLLLVEMAQG